ISALEINEYSLDHNSFTVTYLPSTLARGDSGFIRILYHPLEEGYHSANLTIFSNDDFHGSLTIFISGQAVTENSGQNMLSYWGWNGLGSAPFGDGFSGMVSNYTDGVLSVGEDQAWFIKDVFLYDYPQSKEALMNLAFKNNITLVINNTLVFDSSAVNLEYWNKTDLDVSKYLSIGRNRIAATVRTDRNHPDGGFDCELLVNEEPVIKHGNQNWNQTEALWWYFYYPGERAPVDTLYNRFWFSRDYAITGIDSVIASWVFEPNGSDTLYDSTPYGHRAILYNVDWVDGMVGKAMSFSGQNNSYAELDANLNFLPQSIQMWINCYQQKTERQNIITNKGGGDFGHGIFIADDLSLGVYYYNGEIKFPDFKIDLNNWHYISTQYNFDRLHSKNMVILFVDGVKVGIHEYDIQYASSGGNKCYLAANPAGEQVGAFEGAIDEMVITNMVSGTAPQLEIAAIDLWGDDRFIHADGAYVKFSVYPSPFKIISGVFSYTHGGNDNFVEDATFWDPDSIYSSPLQIELPEGYADIRGVKFSLELQTNYGNVRYPRIGVEEFDYDFLRFGTEEQSSNLNLRERIYRMISVPYELQQPEILSVLEDDFGAYDKYRWRLFDWNQADSAYIEFQDSSWTDDLKFIRGKSFWLVTDRLESFDADSGITPEYQDFPIYLQPGWNMIANPFPYPVRWQDVQKDEPGLISDLNYYSAIDLVGWVDPLFTRQMEPWKGYFVFNSDENYRTIIVPASASSNELLPRPLAVEDQYRNKY
ncbi:MAG: LamG-like jellyroll fold domain-containing protein, partial [bacterium]|nr:LamG-like jellyroll fold domain-containing protein [bacterium]